MRVRFAPIAAGLCLVWAGALTGCGASGGGGAADDKGEEDDIPAGGKTDSFRNPTEHGTLHIGAASDGDLQEEARYHAWEFTLAAKADVTVAVKSGLKNLDTVMYLYRRTDPEANWGHYLVKNDDAADSLQSAISRELDAASDRVIVKGYKKKHTGAFTLTLTCAGEGCAAPDDGGQGGDGPDVPAETGFTQGCIDRLWKSLGSKIVYEAGSAVHPEATSGFDKEILVATAHYADLSDWAEYVSDDEERAEFTFEASIVMLETGSVVTMEDGGDESTTQYAFDGDGNLLAYYVHNQSPWTGYFCGSEGDEQADEPTEDCLARWMSYGPRGGQITFGDVQYDPGGASEGMTDIMAAAQTSCSVPRLRSRSSIPWSSPTGTTARGSSSEAARTARARRCPATSS